MQSHFLLTTTVGIGFRRPRSDTSIPTLWVVGAILKKSPAQLTMSSLGTYPIVGVRSYLTKWFRLQHVCRPIIRRE